MVALNNEKVEIHVPCRRCGEEIPVSVRPNDLTDWKNGKLIQNAMPYLTPGERELFISGTCDKCWDKMFNIGDDDDGE